MDDLCIVLNKGVASQFLKAGRISAEGGEGYKDPRLRQYRDSAIGASLHPPTTVNLVSLLTLSVQEKNS